MIEADRAGNGLSQFISATPYPLVMCQYRNLATRHPRDGSLREHQAILAALRTNNSAATEAATRRALTLNTTTRD